MKGKPSVIPSGSVEGFIRLVRGQRVILDEDLARIYAVTTARLNQQVKRNLERFPADFVFRVTAGELAGLMLQFATSNKGRGGRRKLPYAFTEHGAIMAANVLNSRTAVHMSVFVVRAFVKMRETLTQNSRLAAKLAELERRLTERLDVHEKAIVHILDEIRQLMAPSPHPVPERRQIGFHVRDEATNASRLARRQPPKRLSQHARPDTLYKAKALGRSKDGSSAADHDVILYPKR